MSTKFVKRAAALVLAAAVTALAACTSAPTTSGGNSGGNGGNVGDGGGEIKPSYTAPTFLTAVGTDIKNTAGETVYLRGVNAGGLFVTEHWMTGFIYGSTPSNDYRSLTQTLIERFGEDKTIALWEEYRSNWWTEKDFATVAGMGMNTIRLPFTYMNVDFAAVRDNDYADAGKSYDFSALDNFVKTAAEYGLYTILDLHGAYGSQNGQDHSGQIFGSAGEVGFYSDERMMGLTVNLWSAIAEHYKDNTAVAAYDILNEPGEKAGTTSERHFAFYDKVYDAIRATGDNHIVTFESCWDGDNLPQPSEYGWENCMYSFHHYSGDKLSVRDHGKSWNDKMTGVCEQNFGVPLQMGEFTNYGSAEKWEYILDRLNNAKWHWTSWTYKVWGTTPWGIIDIRGTNDQKVNVSTDEYDDILGKFALLQSDSEVAQKYTFYNTVNGEAVAYKTLEQMFRDFALAAPLDTPNPGYYEVTVDDMWLYDGNTLGLTDDYNLQKPFKITYTDANDGSATVTLGGRQLYVGDVSGVPVVRCGKPSSTDAGLFYPMLTSEGELVLESKYSCKYVRLIGDSFTADASRINDACPFIIHGATE